MVADKIDEKIGVKYNSNRNTGGSKLIKKSAESKKFQKLKGRKLLDLWKNVAAKLQQSINFIWLIKLKSLLFYKDNFD